jgi:hypothetical protein
VEKHDKLLRGAGARCEPGTIEIDRHCVYLGMHCERARRGSAPTKIPRQAFLL